MPVSATPPAFVRRWWPWILIVAAALILPVILPPFRLNLLGRFLSLGIVALGVDLIWGYTGLLSHRGHLLCPRWLCPRHASFAQ